MKRVGIDTNILLRLIVNDDPIQRQAVLQFGSQLNQSYIGVLTLLTLVETDWALRTVYQYSRSDSVKAIRNFTRIRGVELESLDAVIKALDFVESRNIDFSDGLISFRSQELGCEYTATLDKRAASRVPGMELLQ